MREFSIVICDSDAAYVNALSQFLCGFVKQLSVVAFTEIDAFQMKSGCYQMGLLGKEFLQVYRNNTSEIKIEDVYYLSSSMGEDLDTENIFYKYQNMMNLKEIIDRKRHEEIMDSSQSERPKVYGIYSPIHHDLRVPFGLSFSHLLSQKKATVFLDAEQFSILPSLIPEDTFHMDFMDLLYLLESQKDEFDLNQYLYYFEDVAILPVAKNPKDFMSVSETTWDRFYQIVLKNGFQLVVVFNYFDEAMEALLPYLDELILLGRSEDYYRYAMACCQNYLSKTEKEVKLHAVNMNMSATGLKEGCFDIRRIMEGNMAGFIRDEFKGSFATTGIKQN